MFFSKKECSTGLNDLACKSMPGEILILITRHHTKDLIR